MQVCILIKLNPATGNDVFILACNACVQLKLSLEHGSPDDVFVALNDPALGLLEHLNAQHKHVYFAKLAQNISTEAGLIMLFKNTRDIVKSISEMSPDQIEGTLTSTT